MGRGGVLAVLLLVSGCGGERPAAPTLTPVAAGLTGTGKGAAAASAEREPATRAPGMANVPEEGKAVAEASTVGRVGSSDGGVPSPSRDGAAGGLADEAAGEAGPSTLPPPIVRAVLPGEAPRNSDFGSGLRAELEDAARHCGQQHRIDRLTTVRLALVVAQSGQHHAQIFGAKPAETANAFAKCLGEATVGRYVVDPGQDRSLVRAGARWPRHDADSGAFELPALVIASPAPK